MATETEASARPRLRFGVMHDCRRHPESDTSMTDVYRQTLEQAVLADELGFDHVESGPLVRSSYRAGRQAEAAGVWTRPTPAEAVPAS